MEGIKKIPFKAIFYFPDYKEDNMYQSIKFETLLAKTIKIDNKEIKINVDIVEENCRGGYYDEIISIIPENNKYEIKKYNITLFCDINNTYEINLNEEGDCGIEITVMWDVNNGDSMNTVKREIPDIEYGRKRIEHFEKLFERKRWNILNAKIDKFGKDIFSKKTIEYIKKNKNKSFKYDIILNGNVKSPFLSEKMFHNKSKFLDDIEKKKLKKSLESQISLLKEKIKNIEETKNEEDLDIQKFNLAKFKLENTELYQNLNETFNAYNGKWNLNGFSHEDFNLFLLFSEFKLYSNYINKNYRKNVVPKYNEILNRIKSNNSLNLIEKCNIICGFSKFCSSMLIQFFIPELILVQELKDDEPYKIAIEKHKTIINEFKERSGYFKKILMSDMGSTEILNDWDFEDYEIENLVNGKGEYITFKSKFKDFKNDLISINKLLKKKGKNIRKMTFPVLSMLTFNQVKNHSLNLLPKYFFKIDNIYPFNAVSDAINHVTFFNTEKILFLDGGDKDEDNQHHINPKACVLPLMIELSHEIYAHLKVRYTNSSYESPLLSPIKGQKKFLCPNDYNTESGYALEYLFVDDPKELIHLKRRNIDLYELTESKYWTDINFNKLKEFNKRIMDKNRLFNASFDEDFENMAFYDKGKFKSDRTIKCVF